ncbi:MAG TPA: transglycosylase SLT domain-containing protein [Geobacteraceae bacterium]|nr:transglycosylase SLT domain-containing protein [Geobacteraceae bacterium]
MKAMLLLLVALLPASFAQADETDPGSPGEIILTASASADSHYISGSAREGRRVRQSGNLNVERDLGRDLELPPSDHFVQDDTRDYPDEFERSLSELSIPPSDIPLTVNNKVEYFVNYFQTSGRKAFAKWLSRSERYIPMMREILKKKGLPEDLVYVAMIESGFSPHAYSVASAVGPWQFMSGTGKRFSLRIDPWIDERRDPIKSTVAAAMYLKDLYSLFNKDWYLAAAGYNAGENKILRAINMYESRDFWQLSEGSYLKRETKEYVPKLLAAAIIAKDPARYGFADVAYLPPIEFDTVFVPTRTDLELVARLTGVSCDNIRELNPELRKQCTPPDYPNYELKLPKGKKDIFLREYAKIPENERYVEKVAYTRYRAGRKDTLGSISRRFGVKPDEIAQLNDLKKSSRLRGKDLLLPVKQDAVVASSEARQIPAVKSKKAKKQFVKYYTVKKGDTLRSVARRFSVSEKIIAAWNNLKGKMALNPGKRIIVAKFVEKNGSMVPHGDENG